MPKINLKNSFAAEKIGDFGGICRGIPTLGSEKPLGAKNASDCRNFRILPSGSLEKRCGFKPLMTLPAEPRAFLGAFLDGEYLIYALIGENVYAADPEKNTCTVIGSVGSAEGKAEIFFFDGMLYVLDGECLYRYDGEDFVTFHGYVPLYGKNLDGSRGFAVNEPVNLLSDRIRVHYRVGTGTLDFCVGVKCKSILSLTRNKTYNITSSATLDADGLGFHLSSGSGNGDEYEAVLLLDGTEERKKDLLSSVHAVIYGGENDGRMILYGGRKASNVYVSREVSHASYIESLASDALSTGIYFPETDVVSVSYGRHPVTAVCRHFDRLLIFTEGETWTADFSASSAAPKIIPVNSSVGCLSEHGAVLGGTTPYSVSSDGIYKWTSKDDERNECNALPVSGPISELLGGDFFSRCVAFYLRSRDEVWFADPESETQDVFIYSQATKKWFRFDGIPVDLFFPYAGEAAMLYGKYIFVFSEELFSDVGIGGTVESNIEAVYESNAEDFGKPESLKRLKRLLIKADCGGEPFEFDAEGDMGGKKTIVIGARSDAGAERYITHVDARSNIGRFGEMIYRIRALGRARTRIDLIALSAGK